jgi:hypothetical protein
MIAEGIQAVKSLVESATTPRKIDIPDPRNATYVVAGNVQSFEVPPAPRSHTVGGVAEIVSLANRFKSEDLTPAVWYDAERVVLVIDDAEHRVEHATLILETSDVWNVIVGLRKSESWLEPKAFVHLLRVKLARTLDPTALLNAVRALKFEAGQVTTAVVKRANESWGKEINAKASSDAGALPEEVALSAPVYKTLGQTERYLVMCAVEIDPAAARLQLLPLPDEIERVQQMAVTRIGQELADTLTDEIPCYQGKP